MLPVSLFCFFSVPFFPLSCCWRLTIRLTLPPSCCSLPEIACPASTFHLTFNPPCNCFNQSGIIGTGSRLRGNRGRRTTKCPSLLLCPHFHLAAFSLCKPLATECCTISTSPCKVETLTVESDGSTGKGGWVCMSRISYTFDGLG